jgi:Family of unknown function (DUF6879)
VTGDILDECFAWYHTSAVRLETRPEYRAGEAEAERIQAWKRGLPRPERSVRTNDYLREVAAGVLNGRERQRFRIVDEPISDYVRYQLVGYGESQAAGEQVFIAVRNGGTAEAAKALAGIMSDAWFFDLGTEDERCVLMEYEADGTFTAAHLATSVDHRYLRKLLAKVAKHSVPFNEYLAQVRRRTAAA